MLNNKDVYEQSIVNHIYFLGSIRVFCTAIGLTFFKNNQEYIDKGIEIGRESTRICDLALSYLNEEIASQILNNEVYITKYTKELDDLTEKLFKVDLENQVDKDINILKTRKDVVYTDELIKNINDLNNQGLKLVNDFKTFVSDIKNKLDKDTLFSYLYPNFFTYMYDEVSVYGRDLERIISRKDYTKFYLSEFTFYFNELLKKSSEYIRGFLDTTHQDLFDKATIYIDAFGELIEKYLKNNSDITLFNETEELVNSYKVFVISIIEKLLNKEIYFIIPPIVLDNFLTDINVYLFILKYARTIK